MKITDLQRAHAAIEHRMDEYLDMQLDSLRECLRLIIRQEFEKAANERRQIERKTAEFPDL